ncbi:MAG: M28 family metallopeptidase, partial [Thermomicrobiales bacterium]
SKSEAVIVCGHYDTFWNTVGAYDNGSGVVALLELARRWSTRPPRRPVRLVFFAAEEWHLAGSRAFAAGMSQEDRDGTAFVINLDGLGRGNLLECSVGPETFEQSVTAEIELFATSNRPKLQLSSRFPPLAGTDHAPFYAAGIPSMHLTFNDWNLLHRPEDTPKRAGAGNIAWMVPLVDRLVERLNPAERAPAHDIL